MKDEMSICQTFYKVITILRERVMAPLMPSVYEKKWKKAIRSKSFRGVSDETNNKIIVSLTTFPARVMVVNKVIKSLMLQTKKPEKIVLWLAEEQFPNKLNDLPKDLVELVKYGLEIEWCSDLRSYKKLIPTIMKYPDSIIITTDDDLYYPLDMIEKLYKEYLKNPEDIVCHRATKFTYSDGKYDAIPGGFYYYKGASYRNKLVGCSGVLYPVGSLHDDVTNFDLFMKLAPTNDDIWFWIMGIRKGTKVRVAKKHNPYERTIRGTQQGEQLSALNDSGEKLFWKQFEALLAYYPEVDKILREERFEPDNESKSIY